MHNSPLVLVILDGFGYALPSYDNAISQARTPTWDMLCAQGIYSLLDASGKAVGLPAGYVGNSEVGHMTIGLGRIVKQALTKFFDLMDARTLGNVDALQHLFSRVQKSKGRLHIIGLLSDGGVHAHIEQICALIREAHKHNLPVIMHGILDGCDVPLQSAGHYLEIAERTLKECGGKLGSLHGRFYAMARAHNWDRTQKSYQVLVDEDRGSVQSSQSYSWQSALASFYERESGGDSYFEPLRLIPDACIRNGDALLCANIRPERMQQLASALITPTKVPFRAHPITFSAIVTAVPYDEYPQELNVSVIIKQECEKNSLKEQLAQQGKRIFSIAESEKITHVTYFFDGCREMVWPGEKQIEIPSLPVRSYAYYPEMSAAAITQAVIDSLKTDPYDFYVINYANADLVAHTGDLPATILAIECLDAQLTRLSDATARLQGTLMITADHGNAEDMYDERTQQVNTAHTANQVPFICVGPDSTLQKIKACALTQLAHIAPCIMRHFSPR